VPNSEAKANAFVIMPFNEESNLVYAELIAPPLKEVGYSAKRADSVIDQRSVLSDIVLGIDEADLIVADLTGLNPNVFYELGIAHGLGVPTVLITQSLGEIPFDLKSYRTSEYSTRFDEANKLKQFLREVGAEAATGGVKFSSPVSDFLAQGPAAKRLASAVQVRGAEGSLDGPSVETSDTDDADDADAEPGSLDLLHMYVGSAEAATEILAKIGEETNQIGVLIAAHTERMQKVTANPKGGAVAQSHRIATDVARDLNAYAAALKRELPPLESASEEMIDSGIKWLTLTGPDQDKDEVVGFRLQLAGMYVAIADAMTSTRDYRDSFRDGRGITSQLDKAYDQVTSLLSRVITVMEQTQSFASRGSDIAQELLEAPALHLVLDPDLPCFSDSAASEEQPFRAILISIFDRGVEERAFPRGVAAPERHSQVTWEFDPGETRAQSWIVHPHTHEIQKAWESAHVFIGTEIEVIDPDSVVDLG
jgi:hypothetical protein